MRIRIEAGDLPGRMCGPGPDYPDGHPNIHVALQGRKGADDLVGMVPGDAASATWELECTVVGAPPADRFDVRGPEIQGRPGRRFIYLSWGVVDDAGGFRMFRRAKLLLDAVPDDVAAEACRSGLLVARLGLTDGKGNPKCAGVGPSEIAWAAA